MEDKNWLNGFLVQWFSGSLIEATRWVEWCRLEEFSLWKGWING